MSEVDLLRKLLRMEGDRLYWNRRTKELHENDRGRRIFNTIYAEKEAFTNINPTGYRRGRIFGKNYLAHRVIWAIHYGEWPKLHIDHINGNKLDNRIENLRDVDNSENQRNHPLRKNNKSGVVGVSWDSGCLRWKSQICINGRNTYLGVFKNFEDAKECRRLAEKKHGYHENHGRLS